MLVVVGTTPITTPKDDNDIQEKIIELLRTNNTISATEIANALGNITRDGVRYHLNRLKAEGKSNIMALLNLDIGK